jgi:hypothetical protein
VTTVTYCDLLVHGLRSLPEYWKDMRNLSIVNGSQNKNRAYLWKTHECFLREVSLSSIYFINYKILNLRRKSLQGRGPLAYTL